MTWTGEYFKCNQCGEVYPYRIRICPFCGCSCICIKTSPIKICEEWVSEDSCVEEPKTIEAESKKTKKKTSQNIAEECHQASNSSDSSQTILPNTANVGSSLDIKNIKRIISVIAFIIAAILVVWLVYEFVWPVLSAVFGWIWAIVKGILWVIKGIWTVIMFIFKPIIWILSILL